jgi:hypothetical protein
MLTATRIALIITNTTIATIAVATTIIIAINNLLLNN